MQTCFKLIQIVKNIGVVRITSNLYGSIRSFKFSTRIKHKNKQSYKKNNNKRFMFSFHFNFSDVFKTFF